MNVSRKVKVSGNAVYQGDGGVDCYVFEVAKDYGEVDLSQLSAYLKIAYSDEVGDMIPLEKEVVGDVVKLTWKIEKSQTVISGKADCQIVFESDDGTTVFNSEVFELLIKKSVEVDFLGTSGMSQLEQLVESAGEKLDKVDDFLSGGLVSSVNGMDGNVNLSAADLGAATTEDVAKEVEKFKNGDYVVGSAKECATAQKAAADGAGNDISSTYFKKSSLSELDWQLISRVAYPTDGALKINLGGNYRQLFVVVDIINDEDTAPKKVATDLMTRYSNSLSSLCLNEDCWLEIYKLPRRISYKLEMIGCYVRAEKVAIDAEQDYAMEISGGDVSLTVGKELRNNYIDNLELRFYDENTDDYFPLGTTVTVYGIKSVG